MKPQAQNWQERERQLEKLRKRLHPFTGSAVLRDAICSMIIIGGVIWSYNSGMYNTDHDVSDWGLYLFVIASQIISLIYLIMIWINHWLNGASIREIEKNLSAGELLEMFEKEHKKIAKFMTFSITGLLILGSAHLIGIIDYSYGWVLIVGSVAFAISLALYWHYKKSESMACQILQEQHSI